MQSRLVTVMSAESANHRGVEPHQWSNRGGARLRYSARTGRPWRGSFFPEANPGMERKRLPRLFTARHGKLLQQNPGMERKRFPRLLTARHGKLSQQTLVWKGNGSRVYSPPGMASHFSTAIQYFLPRLAARCDPAVVCAVGLRRERC